MRSLTKDDVLVLMWLVALATSKRTQTYSEMALHFGGLPLGQGQTLFRVGEFCFSQGLPLLSVLVVSKEKGIPSNAEFYAERGVPDMKAETVKCFEFDWARLNGKDAS
ncbi:MAG: hypothetical protein R3D34_12125 [Nitratireductor sp.]